MEAVHPQPVSAATASSSTLESIAPAVRPSAKITAVNNYYLINAGHPHLTEREIAYNNDFVKTLNTVGLRIQDFRDGAIKPESIVRVICGGNHRWYGHASDLLTVSGDKYQCSEMLIRGCPICPWLKQFYTTGGATPVEDIDRTFDTRSVIAQCPCGHRFLIEDVRKAPTGDKVNCPVCAIERKIRYTKKINIVFLNSVYTDSACQLRYLCMNCRCESYVAADNTVGANHGAFDCVERMHAPEKYPEFIRMRRTFETVFKRRFDDYDAKLFAQVYPCGYNAQLGIVYFHEAHNRGSSVGALVARLQDVKIRVVVFPRDCVESAAIVRHFLQVAATWGMYQPEHIQRDLQNIRTEERETAQKTKRLFNVGM